MLNLKLRQIIPKHLVPAKNTCIFSIETKNQTHTKLIQALQRLWIVRIFVLGMESIIQKSYNFTCFYGNFHFLRCRSISKVHQELKSVILLFQIREHYFLRFPSTWFLHVVDIEFSKIAGNNPSRVLGKRKLCNITLCLLKRSQIRTIALLDGFSKIFAKSFLLNEDFCRWNEPINE